MFQIRHGACVGQPNFGLVGSFISEEIMEAERRSALLVTHAETLVKDTATGLWLSDPTMTADGEKVIKGLRPKIAEFLAGDPKCICVGTDTRHLSLVNLLFPDTKAEITYSEVWGGSTTVVSINEKKYILVGDGQIIPFKAYTTPEDLAQAVRAKIVSLPSPFTVILSGRPVLTRLGMKVEDCQSGAIYQLTWFPGDPTSIQITLVIAGKVLIPDTAPKS